MALTPYTRAYGNLPLTQITPFTYRDGLTFLQILNEFERWLREVTPEIDGILKEYFDQYKADHEAVLQDIVNTKTEWQNLFDQFMADVVAQLEALNDQAVANLILNKLSVTGALVNKLFLEDKDLTHPFKSSVFYGVTNRATLETAIANAPEGSRIALPRDLEFALGATPINISRGIEISGGIFTADATAFNITGDNVKLSDMKIVGIGSHQPYRANKPAINIVGKIDAYIKVDLEDIHISEQVDGAVRAEYIRDFKFDNVVLDKFRYVGIALLSARDGLVTGCTVKHCNQDLTINLSYGMFASDQVNLVEHRSQNVTFYRNTIHDIPGWEGMDTHGGLNIRFIENNITKTRNAIVMGVGSNIRKTAPEGCQAIGNYIDGMDATSLAPENGILLGGSSSDNVNGALYADAIIVNNTIRNCIVKVNATNIMSSGLGVQSERIDYEKTIVANNGGDARIGRPQDRSYEETAYDTGWKEATEWGSYATGHVRNAQWPLEMRVVGDHRGRTVFMRGATSIISAPDGPTSSNIFRVTHPALIPSVGENGMPLGLIMRNDNNGATHVAVMRADGRISSSFPNSPMVSTDGYPTLVFTWRV